MAARLCPDACAAAPQFMQREQNEEEVAVKFFLSHSAFERELGYYSDPKLRGLLVPVVHHAGDDDGGGVRTRSDYRFPPFIVVERGEVCSMPPVGPLTRLHVACTFLQLYANARPTPPPFDTPQRPRARQRAAAPSRAILRIVGQRHGGVCAGHAAVICLRGPAQRPALRKRRGMLGH